MKIPNNSLTDRQQLADNWQTAITCAKNCQATVGTVGQQMALEQSANSRIQSTVTVHQQSTNRWPAVGMQYIGELFFTFTQNFDACFVLLSSLFYSFLPRNVRLPVIISSLWLLKTTFRPDGILSLNKNTHLIAEEHISSGMLLRCNIRSFLDRRLSFFLQKM